MSNSALRLSSTFCSTFHRFSRYSSLTKSSKLFSSNSEMMSAPISMSSSTEAPSADMSKSNFLSDLRALSFSMTFLSVAGMAEECPEKTSTTV